MQENQVRLEDSMELLDIAMILTEEINAGIEQDSPEFISLAIVWSLIQRLVERRALSVWQIEPEPGGPAKVPIHSLPR